MSFWFDSTARGVSPERPLTEKEALVEELADLLGEMDDNDGIRGFDEMSSPLTPDEKTVIDVLFELMGKFNIRQLPLPCRPRDLMIHVFHTLVARGWDFVVLELVDWFTIPLGDLVLMIATALEAGDISMIQSLPMHRLVPSQWSAIIPPTEQLGVNTAKALLQCLTTSGDDAIFDAETIKSLARFTKPDDSMLGRIVRSLCYNKQPETMITLITWGVFTTSALQSVYSNARCHPIDFHIRWFICRCLDQAGKLCHITDNKELKEMYWYEKDKQDRLASRLIRRRYRHELIRLIKENQWDAGFVQTKYRAAGWFARWFITDILGDPELDKMCYITDDADCNQQYIIDVDMRVRVKRKRESLEYVNCKSKKAKTVE
jgi:hypothetical protein